MANEVLAKVAAAEARRRPGLRVKSLGWGPWEGGMVSPHLQARFAELGVPMIPLAQGACMFADEMADAGRDGVELVLGGEPRAEALLFDGAEQRVDALEFSVQRTSHGWLEGHAVDGAPVVPVVLVAEWLTRAARSFRPGLSLTALHDLKVLKGIRLDRFENGGDRFRIDAQPLRSDDATLLQMTLRDEAGRPRYSARAELQVAACDRSNTSDAGRLRSTPGPAWRRIRRRCSIAARFELIEQMQGISDDGVAARVLGVQAADVADAGLATRCRRARRRHATGRAVWSTHARSVRICRRRSTGCATTRPCRVPVRSRYRHIGAQSPVPRSPPTSTLSMAMAIASLN
jgi:hypothetical protein